MEIRTIGIDLAKTVFHLVALNAHGDDVSRNTNAQASLSIPLMVLFSYRKRQNPA